MSCNERASMKILGVALLVLAALVGGALLNASFDPGWTPNLALDGLALLVCVALIGGGVAALIHRRGPLAERLREKARRRGKD